MNIITNTTIKNKYCEICGKSVGKLNHSELPYREYYIKGDNLIVCDECINKDPYTIVESLLNRIYELEDLVNELEINNNTTSDNTK